LQRVEQGAIKIMETDALRRQLAAALARVAAGDRTALKLVYQDTSAKLFGVCVRILGDRREAEDVLQDVYLTVWRRASTFDTSRASPITWLVAVARNRCIDRLRSTLGARREASLEEAEAVSDPAPDAVSLLEDADQQRLLQNCLGELEDRQAGAIRAAFLEGLTYEELAKRAAVPLSTMKSLIRRGLTNLRSCLEQ
jgi:RNA polymerase sigma factor (sigma-70 family)